MSNLKAAIITAILGSSTAAMASPSASFSADASFSWGTTGAPVIRDHRTPVTTVAYQQQSSSQFLKLASALDLSTGRDILRMPGMNLRTADGLTLRATYGQGFVRAIQVRYRNGSMKTIQLNQWMTARNPAINVALNGNRQIESIVIFGSSEGRLQYQVFAQLDDNSYEMPRPPVYQPSYPQLSGTYQSNYGDVYLSQSGNNIHGTYPNHRGTIDGTIEGNVVHFRWTQADGGGTGFGTWTIDGAGHLNGSFSQDANPLGTGTWNLTLRTTR